MSFGSSLRDLRLEQSVTGRLAESTASRQYCAMTTATMSAGAVESERRIWGVIAASSAGTVIEWYDFYIFGSLSATLSGVFYPGTNPTYSLLKWLATFAAGFAVRPFGALVFGRIGDLVGRKYAFMMTLLIMGGSTALIGLLPGYGTLGIFAPVLLVTLRLAQGLALGGEYGGAAVYVAEHAPDGKRGYYTSFIQTTATLGLFVSLLVILATKGAMTDADFKSWGWRIPFLLSAVLVVVSAYIRSRMAESPLFAKLKAEGRTSKAPIAESYGSAERWKVFFIVLFGATAGQAVVWYTGQFYALIFLQSILKIPLDTSYKIIALGLLFGTPFFVVFGALSDRIGRKKIIMTGCLLGALTYIPIYHAMSAAAEPIRFWTLVALIFVQVLYVTMVYGPIAAFLVESFPARIRYTSLSLPYHFGNGWFGGFTPVIATAIVAATGNRYAGLWFPIGVAALTFVVGSFALRETRDLGIWHEVE
jgi:MFS family permease